MRRAPQASPAGSSRGVRTRTSRRVAGAVVVCLIAIGIVAPGAGAATSTGRVYEQVSPADKNGYPVFWKPRIGSISLINIGLPAVARNGEAATFSSWGVFAGSEDSLIQTYRSRRTPSGWVTTPGAPAVNVYHPDAAGNPAIPAWFMASADLGQGLIGTSNSWSPRDVDPESPLSSSSPDLYLRNEDDETLLMSADQDGNPVGTSDIGLYSMAMARSGGHVLFPSVGHLVPEDAGTAPGVRNVYEHEGGVTRLVSEAPGGGPADPACGSSLVAGPFTNVGVSGSGQSSDGSRVVFQTAGQQASDDIICQLVMPVQLYLRLDGNRTVKISESQRSEPDPSGTQPANYVGASEDLSRIYFVSQEKLTDGADAQDAPYLYEFDTDTENLTVAAESVGTVWAVSANGSAVYFSSGLGGDTTLYRASDGQVTPIVTSGAGIDTLSLTNVAVASDDGSSLLFLARQNLTGYDSQNHDEAYLYRVGEPLSCLSCGVPGDPPTDAHIALGNGNDGIGNELGRYGDSITTDGSLVSFDTASALLPADTNNRRDVYEYDAAAGKLSLVTDGKTLSDSYVYGMSRSGRDVFLVTNGSLVPQDTDGGDADVYDARRGGGFPAGEGQAKLECGGEACQAPASASPVAGTPGSSGLSAPATAKPRRTGRCVKPRRHGKRSAAARSRGTVRCAQRKERHTKGKAARRAGASQSLGKGR